MEQACNLDKESATLLLGASGVCWCVCAKTRMTVISVRELAVVFQMEMRPGGHCPEAANVAYHAGVNSVRSWESRFCGLL